MLPPVRGRTPGDEPVPVVDGVHAAIRRAPLLMQPVLAALSVALLPRLIAHASSTAPTAHQVPAIPPAWLLAMIATPFLVAACANVRPLSRWFIPCRTVAWSLLWSSPVVFFIVQASPQNTMFAVIAIWVIAAAL